MRPWQFVLTVMTNCQPATGICWTVTTQLATNSSVEHTAIHGKLETPDKSKDTLKLTSTCDKCTSSGASEQSKLRFEIRGNVYKYSSFGQDNSTKMRWLTVFRYDYWRKTNSCCSRCNRNYNAAASVYCQHSYIWHSYVQPAYATLGHWV